MPRYLEFSHSAASFSFGLNKVDRTKLYGSVSLETLDIDGNRCNLATLANDGRTLIPHGGTSFGYINRDGLWIERSELKPVNLDGEELQTLPSSFDAVITLKQTVPLETYLDHSIRLCYQLDTDDDLPADFVEAINDGTIFHFPFLYRAGVTPAPAFLMADQASNIWMMVGAKSAIAFTGLDQAAVCAVNNDNDEDEESDNDFSFDML